MRRDDPENFHPAPHFNLWAAAWIQFMTHDWFSHADEGRNETSKSFELKDGRRITSTLKDDLKGIRDPKAPRPDMAFRNHVTHWWDASQLYGWDETSQARVRDGAKLKLGADGLLDTITYPKLGGLTQERAAFVDNWWLGMSLLHTLFTREHNFLVEELPKHGPPPGGGEWTDDKKFDTARLIVSALIAKIHTIEWTPQLLFDSVGNLAMQSNWNGLLNFDFNDPQGFKQQVEETVGSRLSTRFLDRFQANVRCGRQLVSLVSSFSGLTHLEHTEHFCAPYTLPEEFTSVYRMHAMVPDVIDVYHTQTQQFDGTVEAASLLRGGSKEALRQTSIDDWAATFGEHPCGQITAGNFPRFLTDLPIAAAPGGKVDMAAMDILRDRERGVPRFNDFREQIGLKRLKDFDDFIDTELQHEIDTRQSRDVRSKDQAPLTDAEVAVRQAELDRQKKHVAKLRAVYKTIDDVDLQVGIFSEFVHPHGFVISETQFQIFVLNASRRIFSDRFLTEAYTPEFYTQFGFDRVQKSTLMDLIRQHYPAAGATEAGKHAFNAFDIWDRERDGYSLCPKGVAWFKKHGDVGEAYKNLLCHGQQM
jgi:hypothetical protein